MHAIPPLIASLTPALPSGLDAEAEDAVAEVARFDEAMGRDILPFSSVLLLGEAIASSDIEHITSSARNIALAELSPDAGKNAALVARNVAAMRRAIDASTTVDLDGILALHAELMHADPHHEPGVLRQEQVWIGGFGATPVGAHFIPPHHDRLPALLEDLTLFAQRPDLPRMTQLAITHAQFETIHPFTDGNGRTGRALMHVMLRENGLVHRGVMPISAGLLTDTHGYHLALDAYRDGDPAPVVELFVTSTLRAVTNASQLVHEVRDIRASWDDKLHARRDSKAWLVVELLAHQPLNTAQLLHNQLGLSPTHVPRVMEPLLEAGIVRSGTHFASRSAYWWSPEIMDAVDDFAVRAGRRKM